MKPLVPLVVLASVFALCAGNLTDMPEMCNPLSQEPCSLLCPTNMTANCTQLCNKPCEMKCLGTADCTQNCMLPQGGECSKVTCKSKTCTQTCTGTCKKAECDSEGECMQVFMAFVPGKSSGVCNSKSCIQTCLTGNCDLDCGESSSNCSQIAADSSTMVCNAKECFQGCTTGGECTVSCHENTKDSTMCRQFSSLIPPESQQGGAPTGQGGPPGGQGGPPGGQDGFPGGQGGPPGGQGGPPDGQDDPPGGQDGQPAGQGGLPGQNMGAGGMPPGFGQPSGPAKPLKMTAKCYGRMCEQHCTTGECLIECSAGKNCKHVGAGVETISGKCSSINCDQKCQNSSSCSFECDKGMKCTQVISSDVEDGSVKCNQDSCDQKCAGTKCQMECSGKECNLKCSGKECTLSCERQDNSTMPCKFDCSDSNVGHCNMTCNGYSKCEATCGPNAKCNLNGKVVEPMAVRSSASSLTTITMTTVLFALIMDMYFKGL